MKPASSNPKFSQGFPGMGAAVHMEESFRDHSTPNIGQGRLINDKAP